MHTPNVSYSKADRSRQNAFQLELLFLLHNEHLPILQRLLHHLEHAAETTGRATGLRPPSETESDLFTVLQHNKELDLEGYRLDAQCIDLVDPRSNGILLGKVAQVCYTVPLPVSENLVSFGARSASGNRKA